MGAYLEDSTIMECEVSAAFLAGNWLSENAEEFGIRSAVINIDSQACIKALDHHKVKSKLVQRTVDSLNQAAKTMNSLTIRWVKAHLDDSVLHRGNFFADATAKEAAQAVDEEHLVHPDEIPLPSIATLKKAIYFQEEWNHTC